MAKRYAQRACSRATPPFSDRESAPKNMSVALFEGLKRDLLASPLLNLSNFLIALVEYGRACSCIGRKLTL